MSSLGIGQGPVAAPAETSVFVVVGQAVVCIVIVAIGLIANEIFNHRDAEPKKVLVAKTEYMLVDANSPEAMQAAGAKAAKAARAEIRAELEAIRKSSVSSGWGSSGWRPSMPPDIDFAALPSAARIREGGRFLTFP